MNERHVFSASGVVIMDRVEILFSSPLGFVAKLHQLDTFREVFH